MLPNTSLTPQVCCRPHATRTTTSDVRHRRHTSAVRRSYSYGDDSTPGDHWLLPVWAIGDASNPVEDDRGPSCATTSAWSLTYL